MLDFTFNGVKASDMGIKVMDIRHTVMPAIQDRYETVPGRDGSYLFAQAYGDRIISIDCLVLSTDYKSTRQDIIPISAWLNTKDRARLELNDLPDKYLMAKLTNGGELNRFLYTGTFTLEFNCEPFAYDELAVNYNIIITSSFFLRNSKAYNIDYTLVNENVAREWPLGTNLPILQVYSYNIDYSVVNLGTPRYWPMGTETQYSDVKTIGAIWPLKDKLDYVIHDGAGNAILYNETVQKSFYVPGTADSYPIISIKGTNIDGQISITLNGTTFSYVGQLISTDILTIDCQKYSVKKNGARAMMYFIGEFPKLVAGENTLSWTLSGGATLTELKITTQGRWY
jgi:predicted phage tail component-like protein